MKPRHWLISSFDPFLGRPKNHSMAVMDKIISLNTDPLLKLHPLVLPTEFDRCELVLLAEIDRLKTQGIPLDGVLSVGESRGDFVIETQANNLDHAPQYQDNAGIVRSQQKIFAEREALLPIRFDFDRFNIKRSLNPGFFVCNHLCARMTVACEKDPTLPPFGFIHVPQFEATTTFTTEHCAQTILAGL